MISGSKFTLLIDVNLAGKDKLKELKTTVSDVAKELGKDKVSAPGSAPHQGVGGAAQTATQLLGGLRGGISGIGSALGGIAPQVAAAALLVDQVKQSFQQMSEFGMQMQSYGMKGISMFVDLAKAAAMAGGEMEEALLRIKMFGKFSQEQAFDIVKGVQDIVKYTPFEKQQILELTTTLVQSGISLDAWRDKGGKTIDLAEAMAAGFSQVDDATLSLAGNMKTTAASAILDMAAATGNVGWKMVTFTRGMQRLLATGSATLLRDQLPMEIYDRLSSAGKSGAKAIIEEIININKDKAWFGFSAAASSTFGGILSNYKELPSRILDAIAAIDDPDGPYNKLKRGLIDTFKEIDAYLGDEQFLAAVKDALAPVVDLLTKTMILGGKAIGAVANFIKNHPGLAKLGAVLTLAGSALMAVVGTVVAAAGAFGAFAISVTIGLAVINLVAFAVAPLALSLLPFLALGLVGVGTGALVVAASWQPLVKIFDKARTLISAVSEAFQNWGATGTSVSLETAEELEKAGLMETFKEIVGWIKWAELAWDGFKQRLSEGWKTTGPKLSAAWDKISLAFSRVFEAGKRVAETMGLIPKSTEQNVGEAQGSLDTFADIILGVADVAAWVMNLVAQVIDAVIPHVGDIVVMIMGVYTAFVTLKNIGDVALSSLRLGLNLTLIPLRAIWHAVVGLGRALVALTKGDFAGMGKALKEVYFSKANMLDQLKDAFVKFGVDTRHDIEDVNKAFVTERNVIAAGYEVSRQFGYRKGEEPGAGPSSFREALDVQVEAANAVNKLLAGAPQPTGFGLPGLGIMEDSMAGGRGASSAGRPGAEPKTVNLNNKIVLELDSKVVFESFQKHLVDWANAHGMPMTE